MPRRSSPLLAVVRAARSLCLVLPVVSACSDPLVRARNGAVVMAAGTSLVGGDIERFIASAKNGQPDRNAALYTSAWIDYALLEAADRTGMTLDDSATMAEAIWPEAATALARRSRERMVAVTEAATSVRLAALYQSDRVRVFQLLLVRLQRGTDTSVETAARANFTAARARLKQGATFAEVAREFSEDPSASQGGMIGAIAPGTLAPQLERAGWTLSPGGTSDEVRTGLGLHLLHRATFADARGALQEFESRLPPPTRGDTIRREPVVVVPDIVVVTGGPRLFRTLLAEPGTLIGADTLVLATLKGAPFTAAQGRRWIGALPADARYDMRTGGERPFVSFLQAQAEAELGLRATKAMVLTPINWREYSARYRDGLARAREALGAAGKGTAGARIAAATERALAGGRYVPALPSGLPMVLRERMKVHVNHAAIGEIVSTVELFRVPKDSAKAFP